MEIKTTQEKIKELQDTINYTTYNALILNNLSDEELCFIYDLIFNDSYFDNFSIINDSSKVKGNIHKDKILTYWVDESSRYEADCFYGNFYVQIAENKYLTWSFQS